MGEFEKAIIAAARPRVLAAKAQAVLMKEIVKGCQGDLSSQPLALEPPFRSFLSNHEWPTEHSEADIIWETPPTPDTLRRFQIWVGPDQPFDWNRSELFLKQLQNVQHRVMLEMVGNETSICMMFLCSRVDEPILAAAFHGQFERCTLSNPMDDSPGLDAYQEWDELYFIDLFPHPPYTRLLTQPAELRLSPYESLAANLAQIPPPALGFCQIIFQPTNSEHDWHQNIKLIYDMEYSSRLLLTALPASRNPQQEPSNALVEMAREVEAKAHNDKPTYAAALRIGVVGAKEHAEAYLNALATFSCPFLHGGRSLQRLTMEDYKNHLPLDQLREMFALGLTYRHGFLLNSLELAGLVHIPPTSIFDHRQIPIKTLEPLPARDKRLQAGTQIGTCFYAGKNQVVCIPDEYRCLSVQLIGPHGCGKSTLMENCMFQDIEEDRGLMLLDPHGDLVQRLLYLIPEEHVHRVIYVNPGDPEWVPIFNPIISSAGLDHGRIAEDMVRVIHDIVDGWGDRLENVLRQGFLGVQLLARPTLQDVADIIRPNSENGNRMRKLVIEISENDNLRKFWKEDYKTCQKSDLLPAQNKLSKLLSAGTQAEMLSQPDSLIDMRQIMDEGKILLFNLSDLGIEVRSILGSFILAVYHLTQLRRSNVDPEKRRPFHAYVDEVPLFATKAIQETISDGRKYGTGITVAHQYLSQFSPERRDAMGTVGTTVIFGVDVGDATFFKKKLQDKVEVKDIISLKQYNAIARIKSEIVHIETLKPRKIPEKNCRDRIIAESRRLYCRPIAQVRAMRRRMDQRWGKPFSPLTSSCTEELKYDEF